MIDVEHTTLIFDRIDRSSLVTRTLVEQVRQAGVQDFGLTNIGRGGPFIFLNCICIDHKNHDNIQVLYNTIFLNCICIDHKNHDSIWVYEYANPQVKKSKKILFYTELIIFREESKSEWGFFFARKKL